MAVVLLGAAAFAFAQDLESSFQSLKDAEGKNDAALLKKLSADTFALVQKALAEPAPQAADEKEAWTARINYAHEIANNTGYVLYAAASKGPAAATVDLLAALEQQDPKNKYMDEAYTTYLYALSQTGASAKIPAVAEKGLADFPENTDLLQYLASYARAAKQNDRALGYANRLVAAMSKQTKPESLPAADWEKKRTYGMYLVGVISGEKGQYAAADKNLRVVLPLIKGDNSMTAEALFQLGMANYQLGKMTLNKAKILEAAKFSDQCAAITGPFAAQAWKNSAIMKADAAKMR
jgi:hypothetical protein